MSQFPPPLQTGEKVAVVFPSSQPDPRRLGASLQALRDTGLRVEVHLEEFPEKGYLAASDEVRAEGLNRAFRDPDIRAILPARGGYGLPRILGMLDYDALKSDPKLVVGFSDITALHCAIHAKTGLATFHTANLIDGMGTNAHPETAVSLIKALTRTHDERWEIDCRPGHHYAVQSLTGAGGQVAGRLVGGNMAVMCSLIGTPYSIDADDALLFLEDVNEAPYRIDRMFSLLEMSGILRRVRGVVLGYFKGCASKRMEDVPHLPELDEPLSRYLSKLNIPVLTGIPAGHAQPNLALPLNAHCTIDVEGAALRCAVG